MKILIISDVHFCDKRNSAEYEKRRMELLADFIRDSGAGAVLNLGDTVSRKEYLRPEVPSTVVGFDTYLKWRAQFEIPFIECAIARELDFFAEKLGQPADSFRRLDEYMSVITVTPLQGGDHNFVPSQLDFLENAINSCRTPRILIGSHVPYPGSCSRGIVPGIYLDIPERLRKLVVENDKKIYWCGGHFHWQEQPPRQFGSLTAFYGARFNFETMKCPGYLRMIDSKTGEISTVLSDFNW